MPYDSVYSEKRPPGTLRTAWRKFYSDASAMVGLYGCAFRCIRYRKAYHSLCFRGLAMAPKISEITLTIMTSEPHTITPAEMAA